MKPRFRISSPRPAGFAALLLCMQLALPVSAASLDDLLNAAKLGDAREVVELVARGMDPNSSDPSGNTLLILAAREEQPAVVAELVKQRGVRLDARNAAGDSALMLAALRGYTGIAEQLLKAGAPFEHGGWNPMLYAAFEGRHAGYDFENGESLRAMFDRVTGKLKEIAAAHVGQAVVVVLHGGVLDIINRFVRGNPLEMSRDFLIPNAGINWVSTVDGQWTLESWGETAHLAPGALDELPS